MSKHFLWVEKYRPKTISDTILPKQLKSTFQKFVDDSNIPNLLLTGRAGVGKTTVARAMLDQLDCDYIVINGSLHGNIDTLRNDILAFASTVSFSGGRKYVILDEADYLNPNSTQPALRNAIEEFATNCSFIFTCNYKTKIIEPLHSRCAGIDFSLKNGEKAQMASAFFKRIQSILQSEKVDYEQSVVAELIKKYFPDFRRVINELQRHSQTGEISEDILNSGIDINTRELVESLKQKDWKKMREWVVNNLDNDPQTMFRKIYDTVLPLTSQVPQLVLTIADYQYKAAFVSDQEINLVACLTEIMASVEIKNG